MTRRRLRELEIKRRTGRWPRNHWCCLQPYPIEMRLYFRGQLCIPKPGLFGPIVRFLNPSDICGDTITIARPGEIPSADAIIVRGPLCP